MRYYLVGGAVRDMLLGLAPHEFDILFTGEAEDFLREFPRAKRIGVEYPIVMLGGHEFIPVQGGSLEHDLMNRDFTINALALDERGVLRMLPDTLGDLQSGVIRPVSAGIFRNDPLRIFRAARFAALMPRFSLHPDVFPLMRDAAFLGLLAKPAPERVGKEFVKALAGPKPGNFPRVLAEGKCLSPWFAELEHADAVPAGPGSDHGAFSVLEHTARVMDRIASIYGVRNKPGEAALTVWMGLCHDLGKTMTPSGMSSGRLNREKQGAAVVTRLHARLRLPALWKKAGILAAGLYMKGHNYAQLQPETKVDVLTAVDAARLSEPFFTLVAAASGDDSIPDRMRRDREAIRSVRLPESLRGKGHASGKALRAMRCQRLASLA